MPATPTMLLMPSAMPRWLLGNASVRIAGEFAKRNAPPTPCPRRMPTMNAPAAAPWSQFTDSSTENSVKMAKPRLYMRTRP